MTDRSVPIKKKPPWPRIEFVLSLIGGIFVFTGGLLSGDKGFLGVIFGVLIILAAFMMYVRPKQHVIWGILVLVFAILIMFVSSGGFIIGFILAFAGGILEALRKPTAVKIHSS